MAKIIDGVEYLDNTPVHKTTRLKMPANQAMRMRQMIRHEMSLQAEQEGNETFEEADDFELPEQEPWVSPYEEVFEPDLPPLQTAPEAQPAASAAAVDHQVKTDEKTV